MPASADFSKNYFDSPKEAVGAYSSYQEDRLQPAFEAMVKEIRQILSLTHILDIGCAKGFLVAVLRENGFTAHGVDISEYAVEQAPVFVKPWLRVAELGEQKLDFPAKNFDGIICMGTIEYIRNQSFALDEVDRVLMSGGIILLTTLATVPPNDRYRIYAKNKAHWDEVFAKRGYELCHDKAERILIAYVRKIIQYDLKKVFQQTDGKKRSGKARLVKLLYDTGFSSLLEKYLYSRQMRSGYLMLGYQKKKQDDTSK